VLGARLADVDVDGVVPKLDCTCWVLIKSPTGLGSSVSAGQPRSAATFALVLVDATSGDVVFAMHGA
jgi:hypothetical protein